MAIFAEPATLPRGLIDGWILAQLPTRQPKLNNTTIAAAAAIGACVFSTLFRIFAFSVHFWVAVKRPKTDFPSIYHNYYCCTPTTIFFSSSRFKFVHLFASFVVVVVNCSLKCLPPRILLVSSNIFSPPFASFIKNSNVNVELHTYRKHECMHR